MFWQRKKVQVWRSVIHLRLNSSLKISQTQDLRTKDIPASTSPDSGSVYRNRIVCLSVASASFLVIIPDKSTNFFALFCLRVWYCFNVSSRSESLGLCAEV